MLSLPRSPGVARVAVCAVSLLVCVAVLVAQQAVGENPPPATHIRIPIGDKASADSGTHFRGVNIGGWLVLESWITPSIFAPYLNITMPSTGHPVWDEYSLCEYLGPVAAAQVLHAHWDEWVSEAEVAEIAAAGITHVRVPVGYWIVNPQPGQPWMSKGIYYLDRFLGWCRTHNISVLIDLHGAPGSQNGFDHSGHRGSIEWNVGTDNLAQTFQTIQLLVDHMGNFSDVVVAIELVNEPWLTLPLDFVQNYYLNAYNIVRPFSPPLGKGFDVVIHDSFRLGSWGSFMQPPAYQPVYLDTHIYHCFDDGGLSMSQSEHLQFVCSSSKPAVQGADAGLWTMVGEWSLATTDCPIWLNGFLNGSRWDGTLTPGSKVYGSCTGDFGNDETQFTPQYKQFLRQFSETQMDAYESAHGWFFWTLKTESAPQWNFLMGLREGWIPNPVSNRTSHC